MASRQHIHKHGILLAPYLEIVFMRPLLLTLIKFNTSMDK